MWGGSSPNVTFCGCLGPLSPLNNDRVFQETAWPKMKRQDPLEFSLAPSFWYLALVWTLNFFFPKAKTSSPTETERCIESLIAVFQRHAGRDGNNSKLSKAEFLIFMNTELGAFTKVLVPAPTRRPHTAWNKTLGEWLGVKDSSWAPRAE